MVWIYRFHGPDHGLVHRSILEEQSLLPSRVILWRVHIRWMMGRLPEQYQTISWVEHGTKENSPARLNSRCNRTAKRYPEEWVGLFVVRCHIIVILKNPNIPFFVFKILNILSLCERGCYSGSYDNYSAIWYLCNILKGLSSSLVPEHFFYKKGYMKEMKAIPG